MEAKQSPLPFPDGYVPAVIIKFHDALQLPYQDKLEQELENRQPGDWKQLSAQFPGLTISRLFTDEATRQLTELLVPDQANGFTSAHPFPLPYFTISSPSEASAEAIAKAVSGWSTVELAYVEGIFSLASLPMTDENPLSPQQHHLDAAPVGIDARFAWQQGGGLGKPDGETPLLFVDIEDSWDFYHEDLQNVDFSLLAGVQNVVPGPRAHGTAVLSLVLGQDNQKGGVGVAPAVRGRTAGWWSGRNPTNWTSDALTAIIAATRWLTTADPAHPDGGVLLLPIQYGTHSNQGYVNLPLEADPVIGALLQLVISLRKLAVVEVAGNAGINLDDFQNEAGKRIFDRNSTDFQDTGAIIVGAALSSVPHSRLASSNFGSRVDCYAWGENIVAAGNVHNTIDSYTTTFGGTSGAAAIIAGAALLTQSLSRQCRGRSFSPVDVRRILSDPATGTNSDNPPVDRIGVMPDLKRIIEANHLQCDSTLIRLNRDFRFRQLLGILYGVTDGAPGRVIYPGGGIGPGEPFPAYTSWPPAKRDLLAGLALTDIASIISTSPGQEAVRKAGLDIMQAALKLLQTNK